MCFSESVSISDAWVRVLVMVHSCANAPLPRWRVTKHGRIAMSAAVQLRDVQFPISHLKAAA